MLDIGYEFERRGKKYCVLNNIEYKSKIYVLFSVKQNGTNLNYEAYEVTKNIDGYHLEKVVNEFTKIRLLSLMEK